MCSTPCQEPADISNNILPINNIEILDNEIEEAIDELKNNAASGPDGVPSILLKKCKKALSPLLALFWNESMKTGCIPKTLKESIIAPVHKGGNKSEPANYRPVSLTSHLIRIYEKVLRNKIVKFMEENNRLNKNQHEFRKGRSCLTQLLAHHDNVLNLLEQGYNVDVVYLDFEKAFDKVDHNILLQKLKNENIDGKTLQWIKCFLEDRTQRVVVNGILSNPQRVLSGVPQGSVLGPLLFLTLIGDIDEEVLNASVSSL